MGQGYLKQGWAMKKVIIPWKNQRAAATQAVEISEWCRECGLRMNFNYEWYFNHHEGTTVFEFIGESESYATLCALKWIGDEV